MRLGVIDIGSNTVHLLVVDAYPGAHPLPSSSHKIALRLSEGMSPDGSVSSEQADRLVDFVRECVKLSDDQGVEDLVSFATSAVREAPNGQAVLDRVAQETGVELEVLSGRDEARLTFLAVRRWFGWSSGRLLVLDIGGGSLELASGLDEEPDVAISLPLGAGRVTRDHLHGAHPPPGRWPTPGARTDRARPRAAAARWPPPPRTGSSARRRPSVAGPRRRAAPATRDRTSPRSLSHADVPTWVRGSPGWTAPPAPTCRGCRRTGPGQLLGGALVAEAALDLLDVDELTICPWALREGIILRRLDHLA